MKSILTILKASVLTLILGLTINSVNAQQSIYMGLRLPQMSDAQRTNIGAEAHAQEARGQMIFNTDSNALQYWTGTEWAILVDHESILNHIVNNITQEFIDSILIGLTIESPDQTIRVVRVGPTHIELSVDITTIADSLVNNAWFVENLITTLFENSTFIDSLVNNLVNNSTFITELVTNQQFIDSIVNNLVNNPTFITELVTNQQFIDSIVNNLVNNPTFITELVNNEFFITELINNNQFIDSIINNLVNNQTFITELVNNDFFITELVNNNTFIDSIINNLTNNETFIENLVINQQFIDSIVNNLVNNETFIENLVVNQQFIDSIINNLTNNETFIENLVVNQQFMDSIVNNLINNQTFIDSMVNNIVNDQTFLTEIINNLSMNITQEFADSIMAKVAITGERGITVIGSGTSDMIVTLPEGGANNHVLTWVDSLSVWESRSIGAITTSGTVTEVRSDIPGLTFGVNNATEPVLAVHNLSPVQGQFLAVDGTWQIPANDSIIYTAGFGLDLVNNEFSADARALADSLVSMIINNEYNLGDDILNFIAENINISIGDSIMQYIINNFSQELGDTILNFLTNNLTEQFVDSVMAKVTIEGQTGIIVEGSGTRYITVKLPEGQSTGDRLVWDSDSTRWLPETPTREWFYMPSIVIDVSQDATDKTIDLFEEYLRQFNTNITGSRIIGSTSAPILDTAVRIFDRDELYFFVIGFDDTVFDIHEITEGGVMRFDIDATNVSEETFMNIIFVVR